MTLFCLAWLPAARAEPEVVRVPIFVHMARENDRNVASDAFVARQVARANQIFGAYGVSFDVVGVDHPAMLARMESRAHRNGLAVHVAPGVLHCFIVAALLDVDEPGRVRRGVHWHAYDHFAGRHYVILSAIAEPDVLAHELGHFLGNPRHSDVPGNLMSYKRTETLPFLDGAQQRRLQRTLRTYLNTGELKAR